MDPIPSNYEEQSAVVNPWDISDKELAKIRHERREAAKVDATKELGSHFHDALRAPNKLEDGTYEPKEEVTTDETWIESHGTDLVDVANTNFADLPEDLRRENETTARIIVNLFHSDGVPCLDTRYPDSYKESVRNYARTVHGELLKLGIGDANFLNEEEQDRHIRQVESAVKLAYSDKNGAYSSENKLWATVYNKYGIPVEEYVFGEDDEL